MKTENWCIITLDDEDLSKARVNGGVPVHLAPGTARVVILYEMETPVVERTP